MNGISVTLAFDRVVVTHRRGVVTASVTNAGARQERVVVSVTQPPEVPGGPSGVGPAWSTVE